MRLRPFRFRLIVMFSGLTSIAAAHAQHAVATGEASLVVGGKGDGKQIQRVEVTGNADVYDPRRDDTASKIVMSHEEIVKYGDSNVLDVVKRLPGVTVSGGGIRMRGLGNGYTQVLINGERPPAGFSLESLVPGSIERIEVLRAANVEYSTQSIAGTVNIVLRKAVKSAAREAKTGISVRGGTASPFVSLQISDRLDKLSYLLTINAANNKFANESPTLEEAYDADGRYTLIQNNAANIVGGYRSLNVGPRLSWTFDNGDILAWQTFVNVSKTRMTGERETTTTLGLAPLFPFVDSRLGDSKAAYRTDLNWISKFNGNGRLDIKVGASRSDSSTSNRRFGYAVGRQLGHESGITSDAKDIGYTSNGKFSSPIGGGHTLGFGWDGGYNQLQDRETRRETALQGGLADYFDEAYTARLRRFALFAQDEWKVTSGWSMYLGARWEGIETTSSGHSFSSVKSRSSVWSPVLQTLYKLPNRQGDQVRFAVTRTYKAPQTARLIPRRFFAINNNLTEPDIQGNPNLKPEMAFGIDASYEHYWTKGALLSASVSTRAIKDHTRRAVVREPDGRWVILPINDGDARVHSLELEAKFPLKAVLDSAPPVDVRASISRNWSSSNAVPGPNNRLDAQTPLSATFGADYKFGALSMGGSFVFKNGGPVRISFAQSNYTSVRREVDLYGLWKLNPKIQLRISVMNVLAQDSVNENIYNDPAGTVRSITVASGQSSVRVAMESKF